MENHIFYLNLSLNRIEPEILKINKKDCHTKEHFDELAN
jgi:hypothetical protein